METIREELFKQEKSNNWKTLVNNNTDVKPANTTSDNNVLARHVFSRPDPDHRTADGIQATDATLTEVIRWQLPLLLCNQLVLYSACSGMYSSRPIHPYRLDI